MPGRRGRAGLALTVLLSDAVHAMQYSSESLGLQAPSETGRFLLFLDTSNSLLCLKDFREGPSRALAHLIYASLQGNIGCAPEP